MQYYKYNTEKNDLRKLLMNLWGVEDLSRLHEGEDHARFTMQSNSDTSYHKKFYDKLRSGWPEFMDAYKSIVRSPKWITPDYLYQTTPTLRIHFVDNWATPEFHRDTQKGYDHPQGEKNWIIPMTSCYGNNSLWVESAPDKKDFHPMRMDYGDLIAWDGGKLLHGNKINDTQHTRISFDYRTLHKEDYHPTTIRESATNGLQFKIGSYYAEFKDGR